jgi:hypothetical protein
MRIPELSRADSLSAGDLLVIFSAANNDARAAAMSVLLAFLQENLTGSSGMLTQYYSPNTSGFSVTVAPATAGQNVFLLLTPMASYAAANINLPDQANCVDGQEVLVSCTQAVTALTVSGNGSTTNGAPTTLAANGFFRLRYDGVFKAWYRIG